MQPNSKDEFNTLTTVLKGNVDRFRYDAMKAHNEYSPSNRKLLRKVHPKAVFYIRCLDTHYPVLESLNRKKPYETMRSRIASGLVIGNKEATDITDKLYSERYERLIQQTTTALSRSSRRHATRILRLPSAQAKELLGHYKQATLYQDVARAYRVSIYDPHSPALLRLIKRWRIRRERRTLLRRDTKRIDAINTTLQQTDDEQGDLLRRIVSHNLEIVTLLGIRNEFVKKTVRQPNARRQLEQFEKAIKKFVHDQLDSYTSLNPDATLHQLGKRKQAIEHIIQDLILLDATKRNQLVLLFSEYRQLYVERESILAAQRDRDVYASRET